MPSLVTRRAAAGLYHLGVLAIAIAAFAAIDVAFASTRKPDAPAWIALHLFGLGCYASVVELWVASAFATIAALLPRGPLRYRLGSLFILCCGFAAYVYWTLVAYRAFLESAALALGAVGLAVFLFVIWLPHTRGLTSTRLRACVAIVGIVGGALVTAANYHFFIGLYPTLHAAASLSALGMFMSAAFAAINPNQRVLPAASLVVVALAVSVALGMGDESNAWRYFLAKSEIGALVTVDVPEREKARAALDRSGVARFLEATELPEMPEVRLEDFNVLLIVVDTTRYDMTSLNADSRQKPPTTPHLHALAERSITAHRAYSPSSGTLHSMSALFTMKFPSSIRLETWQRPWFGELSLEETTVPELFLASGYHTFWTGHNHNRVFPDGVVGLEQGFETVDLVVESTRKVNQHTDRKIADRALRQLDSLAATDRRFFGLIFFGNPHGPYVSHGFKGFAAKTEIDRYRQEIRASDVAIGRVLEKLRTSGLLENTIVVVMSDHGEEFGEHGGKRHKSTVYSESIHVPLVIRVPGAAPAALHQPVSTVFVLPWLMLHATTPRLRDAAENALVSYHGPILRSTNGGIVSELVGHDRLKTTLVYRDAKINFDERSGLYEVYDLRQDPLEQVNLWEDPSYEARRDELVTYLDAYLSIQKRESRHKTLPKKVRPKPRKKRPL